LLKEERNALFRQRFGGSFSLSIKKEPTGNPVGSFVVFILVQ